MRSFSTFNKTTVLKNCYNSTCVDEFRDKVRSLIELDLFKGKLDNYEFLVTNGKAEASRLAGIVPQSPNKQEIFVHYNDILGESTLLHSKWLKDEGEAYPS